MNILSGRVVGGYIYAWSGRPINARVKKPLLLPWPAAVLPGVGHPRARAEGNIDTRPPSSSWSWPFTRGRGDGRADWTGHGVGPQETPSVLLASSAGVGEEEVEGQEKGKDWAVSFYGKD